MLEVLNQQFAEYAMKVTDKRAHFIQELESLAKPIHAGITNDKEALSLNYYLVLNLIMLKMKRHDLKKLCLFLDNNKEEKERGISLFGYIEMI